MTDPQTPEQPEAPNTQPPRTQTPAPQAPGSQLNEEEENRGMPPGYGNGEVTGAGAGAGGSGAAEDYDADPAGGGGSFPPVAPEEGELSQARDSFTSPSLHPRERCTRIWA